MVLREKHFEKKNTNHFVFNKEGCKGDGFHTANLKQKKEVINYIFFIQNFKQIQIQFQKNC